jgi:DNA mismatch repair protein MutH
MTSSSYDKHSVQSIYEFAVKLTGKNLAEVTDIPSEVVNKRNRGDLGSLVEQYYFKHFPPNTHDPDFAEAGLELKTTGLVKNSRGKFRAKERLVLTMINYHSIVKEEWDNSNAYRKCRLMLIIFYLYSRDTPVHRRRFVLKPLLYRIPPEDKVVIRRDWELIQKKVKEGKAHELSEGDTFYLGACRKGSGGSEESLQSQPFSKVKAKSRAFSFKQSYLNSLIEGHLEQATLLRGNSFETVEDATVSKLRPYFNLSIEEICKQISFNPSANKYKSLKADLIKRILGAVSHDSTRVIPEVPELVKADIEIKTVTLSTLGIPREHMSFPGFKFLEIVRQSWEDSSFYEKLEKKFLLVVFERDHAGVERLVKTGYWNMPFEDREEAKRVWEETKRRVAIGATDLPSAKESRVAHVRPKARNSDDKILTPQGTRHVKQCFWLNRDYIGKIVERL